MAKGKRKPRRPQPRHRKSGKSQHDRRARLDRHVADREPTLAARAPLTGALKAAVLLLRSLLDIRVGFRLPIIVSGMLLARGRRTASAWFAAAGVRDDWDRFYDALISVGRSARRLACGVLGLIVAKFVKPGARLLLAIDDTPSERHGKHVEGAGVHHDPTPGPAGGEWMYGHSWVTLAFLAVHPLWGVIALPLRSLLYVREKDTPSLDRRRGWTFRTKHELAASLVLWCVTTLRRLGVDNKIWVVADGAYAARPFVEPLLEEGVVLVGRLRKDARLFGLPPERKPGQRGRPRLYGANRISLARRAADARGWEQITYQSRGREVTRSHKTFLATSRLVGGVIRVVLVRIDTGWVAFFCTDPNATAHEILEASAARWAIEEHFHDVKEVCGAGQQQVRNVWSNIGCWNLNQWLYTLVELSTWDVGHDELARREGRPWDNADRRPSHADRRRWICREMLEKQFLAALPPGADDPKTRRLIEASLSLCL